MPAEQLSAMPKLDLGGGLCYFLGAFRECCSPGGASNSMAKRAKRGRARVATRRPARPARRPAASAAAAAPVTAAASPALPKPDPAAMALFEQGMRAMQRHAYPAAAAAFRSLVDGFPSEGPLLDRARTYGELCERELKKRPAAPKTVEERLTAATAALNNDDFGRAEQLARSVLSDDPRQDLALYLLAAIEARRGAPKAALARLGEAISLSPEAGAQARFDSDFESLHDEEEFWKLTEPPPGPGSHGPRRGRRGRSER